MDVTKNVTQKCNKVSGNGVGYADMKEISGRIENLRGNKRIATRK